MSRMRAEVRCPGAVSKVPSTIQPCGVTWESCPTMCVHWGMGLGVSVVTISDVLFVPLRVVCRSDCCVHQAKSGERSQRMVSFRTGKR